MTQTATALSAEQVLNVHKTTLKINTQLTQTANVTKLPEPSKLASAEGAFYSNTSWLSYGDKVKLSFAINEAYLSHFVLIKGLLEFHRPAAFSISYNKADKSFDVVTSASVLHVKDEVSKYLRQISVWLEQEISFRSQLKEMISFERDYRARLAKVYQNSEGYTWRAAR